MLCENVVVINTLERADMLSLVDIKYHQTVINRCDVIRVTAEWHSYSWTSAIRQQ